MTLSVQSKYEKEDCTHSIHSPYHIQYIQESAAICLFISSYVAARLNLTERIVKSLPDVHVPRASRFRPRTAQSDPLTTASLMSQSCSHMPENVKVQSGIDQNSPYGGVGNDNRFPCFSQASPFRTPSHKYGMTPVRGGSRIIRGGPRGVCIRRRGAMASTFPP